MPLNVLADSYPPSAGAFRSDFSKSVIKPYLDFLSSTNSFFMLNVYPYFAYRSTITTLVLPGLQRTSYDWSSWFSLEPYIHVRS